MTQFQPIREIPPLKDSFGPNDTLVVFGELFQRGYANGVVDYAKELGMNVIYSTVGRRDPDHTLRALNEQELAEKDAPLINIPLEAGFDLDPDSNGRRPVEQLKEYGLTGWEEAQLDWKSIEESRANGRARFLTSTRQYLQKLEPLLKPNGKTIFLHTMAGGFPRAKVVMPIANKVFKGSGERFQSSKIFWEGDIGKLCDWNFNEVTAETFKTLIDETKTIREKIQKNGGQVSYLAFGYHGNEVMIGQKFEWYSYSPYLQGWAKVLLEKYAETAQNQSINATVFNVPEILTNSSSIFLGVEVVLYPLMRALLAKNAKHPSTQKLLQMCESKLTPPYTFKDIDQATQSYLTDPAVATWPAFEGWPQHNGPEQMAKMRDTSMKLIEMHKDRKDLMTSALSEVVFKACGLVMLRLALQKKPGVQWIGHDLVSSCTLDL